MCLQAAELSLTRQDVNLLMSRVDSNGDGLIDYAEFVPICFGIMVERFVDTVMRNTMLAASDQLQNYVMHCFRTFDVEGARPHLLSCCAAWLRCLLLTQGM